MRVIRVLIQEHVLIKQMLLLHLPDRSSQARTHYSRQVLEQKFE